VILLDRLIEKDPRFKLEAYLFINDSLVLAQKRAGKKRHITGLELLQAFRDLAIQRYGQMANAVLNSWGLHTTDDIGAAVFNLVNAGLMSKTDSDRLTDFHAVFDFNQVFIQNYTIPDREPDQET